jgi:arylsulfatase
LAPTILEVCAESMPDAYRGLRQIPMHGTSVAYTFDDAAAPSTRTVQYFETAGYRGIYADGYKAIAAHTPGADFGSDQWELYRIADDVSECRDLSSVRPDLVERLSQLWWEQAETYGVLPLDNRMQTRMAANNPAADRGHYRMLAGTRLMHNTVGPTFAERSFRIRARVAGRTPTDEGVLVCWGRRAAGFSLFVREDQLTLDFNLAGDHFIVSSPPGLPTGDVTLELVVNREDDGVTASLRADGELLERGTLPCLVPRGMGTLSTQCGLNAPSAISELYEAPFYYSGCLRDVLIDLGPTGQASEADWTSALAQQ